LEDTPTAFFCAQTLVDSIIKSYGSPSRGRLPGQELYSQAIGLQMLFRKRLIQTAGAAVDD
jgi:hypothetical protein